MSKYKNSDFEVHEIVEEDINMGSGVTLPNDSFDEETSQQGEP